MAPRRITLGRKSGPTATVRVLGGRTQASIAIAAGVGREQREVARELEIGFS